MTTTLRTLKTINNKKRILLEFVGYKSIKAFRRDNIEFINKTDDYTYKYLLDLYNEKIIELKEEMKQNKTEEDIFIKEQLKQMNKKTKTFKIKVKKKKVIKLLAFGTITYDLIQLGKKNSITLIKKETTPFNFIVNKKTKNTDTKKQIDILKNKIITKANNEYINSNVRNFKIKIKYELKTKKISNVNDYKIKQENSINIDGFLNNNLWNINEGKCFADWIQYYYKDCKRMKKKIVDFNVIQELSLNYHDYNLDKNPLQNGFTIPHIENFCSNCDISLYILYNNKLITHTPSKNRNLKCLMIEVKNNHLYGVVDKKKIKSIITINSGNDKIIKKTEIEEYEREVEYEELNKVFIPKINNNTENIYMTDLDYIIHIQKEKNLMIESGKKIIKTDYGILPFKLGDDLIIPKEVNNEMKAYCDDVDIDYQGQNPTFLLKDYMKDIKKSNLNHDVYNALCSTENVKNRTFMGFYKDNNERDIHNYKINTGYDINKCYRYVMENPLDNFMTIDFKTEIINVEEFNNDFGLYFIETEDETILKKSNWYSNVIIKSAYDRGIKFNVKYFIKGKRINKNLLKDIIDKITKKFNNKHQSIMKCVINSISGLLGKTKSSYTSLNIDTNYEEVWKFIKNNQYQNIYFNETDDMYLYGLRQSKDLMDNNVAMYIQILDWGNMMLDSLIMDLGGYKNLMYRKTDYIIMKPNPLLDNTKISKEVGGYKYETLPSYYSSKDNLNIKFNYKKEEWNIIDDINISDDYKNVINHLKTKSLMINARAGTGKSYTIDKVIDHYGKDNCIVLAPTNKSALNIKGKTIHSYFSINQEGEIRLDRLIRKLKKKSIIIIDEYSMVNSDLWGHIYQIKRNSKCRFLICGDNNQLPSIENDGTEHEYTDHPTIKYICDNNMVNYKLTEKSRYDREMFNFLENIIDGYIPNFKCESKRTIDDLIKSNNICYSNKKRKEINKIVNEYHKNKQEHLFINYIDDETNVKNRCKYRQPTYIYKNLPVCSFKTNKEVNTSKNETYIITDYTDKIIQFKNDLNKIVEIPVSKFHDNFIMAYCLTTHKAQGDTLKGIVNIHEIDLMKYNKKLLYTALSRATDLSNLRYYK